MNNVAAATTTQSVDAMTMASSRQSLLSRPSSLSTAHMAVETSKTTKAPFSPPF